MYKQSYLSYHISKCGNFQELLDLLKQKGIKPKGEEWSYKRLCFLILTVNEGAPINYITRENGLRAKVAELVLAKNYGLPLPEELIIKFNK